LQISNGDNGIIFQKNRPLSSHQRTAGDHPVYPASSLADKGVTH